MIRFYRKKNTLLNKFLIIILLIIIIDLCMFKYINNSLNNKITYIANVKLEEMTRYYLNQTLKKYLNIETNDYIKVNLVNNNIINVDINNKQTNELLKKFLNDLEISLNNIEKGKIQSYKNLEFIKGKDGVIILIPIGLTFNTSLLSNMGPYIPVKVSFLENIEMYTDVIIENYGINNSLIKLYLNIYIKELIDFPINKEINDINYRFLISSKLINGQVPSIYYDGLTKNSSIVNNSVN